MRILLMAGISISLLSIATPSRGQPSNLIREEKVIRYNPEGFAEIQVTEHLRPPFYTGPMPLKYVTAKRDLDSFSSTRLTQWSDFGAYRNTFSSGTARGIPGIGASIPGAARTTDPRGRLLAEAHVVNLTKGEGFEISEVHYGGDGTPVFRCRSSVDFSGYKIRELECRFSKPRDPSRLNFSKPFPPRD